MKNRLQFKKLLLALGIILSFTFMIGCNEGVTDTNTDTSEISNIPDYSGEDYIVINNNEPKFSTSDFSTTSWEKYSKLDSLGRCSVAFANIGTDIMPTEKRESISSVKPSGWQTIEYDFVNGKYLYNRCHLIGFQLTAENANELNLITGTRYLNVDGMLPFENMVADYVKETNNHVLYRVTPIFEGNNLVAKGVQMEAMSVEDDGEGIKFNVFIYNIQPGVTIDYSTGNSSLLDEKVNSDETTSSSNTNSTVIRGNSNSKIYHCPGQANYEDMKASKNLIIFNSEDEAIAAGYRKAKR